MRTVKLQKIIVCLIIFIGIIAIANFSNAGLEIKEGTSAYTSVNISESFDICYNLRDGTSTLGNCNLDPHLATSLDWGAVAYLAQSRYGANSSNVSNNTTGNKSGVMNMRGYTQTATMIETRNQTSTNATTYRYRLEEALKDDNMKKYVDLIPYTSTAENTQGRALAETANWYGETYSVPSNTDYPLIMRDGAFCVYSPQRHPSALQGRRRPPSHLGRLFGIRLTSENVILCTVSVVLVPRHFRMAKYNKLDAKLYRKVKH